MEAELLHALEPWLRWLYWQCTDFMIHSAHLLGITYRDTNAGLFFIVWPAVTLTLMGIVSWQAWVLWRTPRPGRRPKGASSTSQGASTSRPQGRC